MTDIYLDLKQRMRHYNVTGLSISVINRGQIERIENYGVLEVNTNQEVDNNSLFNACSISKFLTAMLVLSLTEQGILHLDEDVNNVLTSWKVPVNKWTENKKVTLRNLLCHQSGMIDPENSFMELNNDELIPTMAELLLGKTSYCNEPIEVVYEPNSDFQYSDAGFCIIQQIIEDVTEKPFEFVMEEQIFQPLGMKNSTFMPLKFEGNIACGHNKDGKLVDGKYHRYPYPAAAGLWTTTTDLSLLVIDLMNALTSSSKVGLSANIAKELLSSQGCKEWTGLGVFLDGSEITSLGWGVGFQCMMVAYPQSGNGLIIMTNSDLGVHQLNGIIGEIYHSNSFE